MRARGPQDARCALACMHAVAHAAPSRPLRLKWACVHAWHSSSVRMLPIHTQSVISVSSSSSSSSMAVTSTLLPGVRECRALLCGASSCRLCLRGPAGPQALELEAWWSFLNGDPCLPVCPCAFRLHSGPRTALLATPTHAHTGCRAARGPPRACTAGAGVHQALEERQGDVQGWYLPLMGRDSCTDLRGMGGREKHLQAGVPVGMQASSSGGARPLASAAHMHACSHACASPPPHPPPACSLRFASRTRHPRTMLLWRAAGAHIPMPRTP